MSDHFLGVYNPIYERFSEADLKFFAMEDEGIKIGWMSQMYVEPERIHDAFKILQEISIEFAKEIVLLENPDLESLEIAGSY